MRDLDKQQTILVFVDSLFRYNQEHYLELKQKYDEFVKVVDNDYTIRGFLMFHNGAYSQCVQTNSYNDTIIVDVLEMDKDVYSELNFFMQLLGFDPIYVTSERYCGAFWVYGKEIDPLSLVLSGDWNDPKLDKIKQTIKPQIECVD